MTKKTITFDSIKGDISPPMMALLDDFVTGYMAERSGVTVAEARATIETNAAVRDSYKRKMLRTAVLLINAGQFKLTKAQHTPTAPKAAPLPDVSAMLAGIANKQQPGAAS